MTSFIVAGTPAPQGSKTSYGKGRMVESSPHVKSWRDLVRGVAQKVHTGPALTGAVEVRIRFWLPRPVYHYGTGRNAGRIKPQYVDAEHTTKPDVDKLARAVLDAITEERRGGRVTRRGVIHDDSQVVRLAVNKGYGDRFTGAEIRIGLEVASMADLLMDMAATPRGRIKRGVAFDDSGATPRIESGPGNGGSRLGL